MFLHGTGSVFSDGFTCRIVPMALSLEYLLNWMSNSFLPQGVLNSPRCDRISSLNGLKQATKLTKSGGTI